MLLSPNLRGLCLALIDKPSASVGSHRVVCVDGEFGFDLSSKGHRKDSEKSRSRKDDDSLAEASHSKKTVKKAGNGVVPWTGPDCPEPPGDIVAPPCRSPQSRGRLCPH